MVVEERDTDVDIVPVDLRSAVDLPFRLGFAIAGVALTAAESAVTIARVTATSVQHEIGQAIGVSSAELGGARAPLALLAQLSDLMSPDRPLGRLIAPGGPLERLVTPGGVVDRLTAKDGPLDQLVTVAESLSSLAPNLERMSVSVEILQDTVDVHGRVATTLSMARGWRLAGGQFVVGNQ